MPPTIRRRTDIHAPRRWMCWPRCQDHQWDNWADAADGEFVMQGEELAGTLA
ncbi:MAG: hypothetical protein ACYCO9_07175 [Streptosporangiaceae bacterium]